MFTIMSKTYGSSSTLPQAFPADGTTVAMIGNPKSAKGSGARISALVFEKLTNEGSQHGFSVMDLTGTSFDDSLALALQHQDDYEYLVVVGGDGMISLGANAVGKNGKPLGIVAIGSGNDFARGMQLPIDRVDTAIEGIVGSIVHHSFIEVDLGHITAASDQGEEVISRYYAGMLSCGIDASINDRANHSHLPNGQFRYFAAVLVELTHMKQYGYHIRAVREDDSIDERDIISPLLTVANSRHIGGGIKVSPYSLFSDGMLDMVWMEHVPDLKECIVAISNAYNGRLLSSNVFGWERVKEVEITFAEEGALPPLLMADGEYVGKLPVNIVVQSKGLRVMVPPAVAEAGVYDPKEEIIAAILRDGRDPITGEISGNKDS